MKMMIKKISAALCALVMTGSAVAAPVGSVFSTFVPAVVASADDEMDTPEYWIENNYKVKDGWVYDIDYDMYDDAGMPIYYAMFRAYIGRETDPIIPQVLGGFDVEYICSGIHLSPNVKSLTMCSTAKVISQDAFRNVVLDNVEILPGRSGKFATEGGLLLNGDKTKIYTYIKKDITIPASVNELGYCQFSNWMGDSVTVPKTVTSMGDYIFMECENLSSVNWQASADYIPYYCFLSCTGLKSFTIPDNIKTIRSSAFHKSGIKSIVIPASVTDIQDSAFEETPLESVTIPEGVKLIDSRAFYNTSKLKSITVPKSVTEIGERAIGFEDGSRDAQIVSGFKMYCYSNTAAEKYAKENGVPYELLDGTAKTDIAKAKVKVNDKVYTGKAVTPSVKVTLGGKVLKRGYDYTVKYGKNKNCGKAAVLVTGQGKYTGHVRAYFIIKPKKAVLSKMTSTKSKTARLVWKKNGGGVSGYQILLATNKRFTAGRKVVYIKNGNAIAKTVTGLKKNKVYYAKIRAYKTVSSQKYYGAWSNTKHARIK